MNTMHPVVGLGSKMQEKDAATLRQEEDHMKGVDCNKRGEGKRLHLRWLQLWRPVLLNFVYHS